MITCLKYVITTTYANCMTKSMKIGCVITVYTVVEQVWFSFLCPKYNFKRNKKFRNLRNIISNDYYQYAANNKANNCFIFVYLGHVSWLSYCITC